MCIFDCKELVCIHSHLTVPVDFNRRCDQVVYLYGRGLVCRDNPYPTVFNTDDWVRVRILNSFCGRDRCHRDTRWNMRTRLGDAQTKYATLGNAYYNVTTSAYGALNPPQVHLLAMVFADYTAPAADHAEFHAAWVTAQSSMNVLESMTNLNRHNSPRAESQFRTMRTALEEIQQQLEAVEPLIWQLQREQTRLSGLGLPHEDAMTMLCRAAEFVQRTDAHTSWRASLP